MAISPRVAAADTSLTARAARGIESRDLSDHDQPHLPPPSLWPIGFAVGIACILAGLVLSWVVAVVGAVIAVVFGFLWIRDVTKPVRTPAPAVEPESPRRAPRDDRRVRRSRTRTATRIRAAPSSPPPRSASAASSAASITVPVLGFAVLPSFTNQHDQDVDLGPIENFPESEFVIATYLEDPKVGEVTRRTMYIRNNGQLDGQPSFTTLYSRCAHLGCPVQPNGPIEEDKKKTYGDHVDLIPVLAVGFGCPCHGGQYDTEGNRMAGPARARARPRRVLDHATAISSSAASTASAMSRARAPARGS